MKRTILRGILFLLFFLSAAPVCPVPRTGESMFSGPLNQGFGLVPVRAQNSGELSDSGARLRYAYTGVEATEPNDEDQWSCLQKGKVTGNQVTLSGEAYFDWTGGEVDVTEVDVFMIAYLEACGPHGPSAEWNWEPASGDGAPSELYYRVKAEPGEARTVGGTFDLNVEVPPGCSVTGGIRISVQGDKGAALYLKGYFEGSEAPVSPETPVVVPTADRSITIRGTVSTLDPRPLPGARPLVVPIIEVPVTLMRGDQVLGRTFSQLPDGQFEFSVPLTDNLVLSTTLVHAVTSPPAFQVVYDQQDSAIWITTGTFDLGENSPDILVKDINLSAPQYLNSGPVPLPPEQIDDVGLIYYHAREAWQMAAILLGQDLDLYDLKIRAFSQNPRAQGTAFWSGPMTGIQPSDPVIEISPPFSDFGKSAAGETVMHEFGHHLMADSFHNMLPYVKDEENHGGFANATSCDSWVEGFATFYAIWTSQEQMGLGSPQIVTLDRKFYNMELNWLAWSSFEEGAVTALLWDLIDPANPGDVTEMPVTDYASQPAITTPVTTTLYGDYVQLDRDELWRMLSDSTLASYDRPPAAPQGYDYIFDVKQLYETLQANGVGLDLPLTPNNLDAVDELFIAHGFFADTNPQNLAWDQGEEIGVTDHGPITIDSDSFPAQPVRRSPPPVDDFYINYQARDAATGASLDVTYFLVTVEFESPHEGYNYRYYARAWPPGQLPYAGPPANYRATTKISVAGSGVEASPSLQFSNEEYWQMRAQRAGGALLDHTFEVELSEEGALGGDWDGGLESEPGIVLPPSSPDLSCLWFLGGGILLVGLLVAVGARSRKKGQAPARDSGGAAPGPAQPPARHSPRPGTAPGPAQPPARPALSCPHCGQANRPGVRFCKACGGSLAPASRHRAAGPGAAGWQLLVVEGTSAEQRYPLGAETRLGRSRDNDIYLQDTQSSRHHALFQRRGEGYVVQDLGSTNGTRVNGQRIGQPVAVKPGDRVQIGNTVFQVAGQGASEEPSGNLVCPHCGQRVTTTGARFCRNCGRPIAG